MRIVLLRTAQRDLVWFRHYDKTVCPQGARRATRQLRQAPEQLAEIPFIGRDVPDRPVRAYAVARTPFGLIHRVLDDRLEVIRVWDARAEQVEGWSGDGN